MACRGHSFSAALTAVLCQADPAMEPELHKAMVLLLARCWDYKLKTEDGSAPICLA